MRALAGITLGLAIAASSAAQMPAPLEAVDPEPADLRVTQLAGRPVQDSAGRRIGRVDDVILDATLMRQHFVALSSVAAGNRPLYFPLFRFRIATNDEKALELEGARGRLTEAERAPGERWPASRFVAASDVLGREIRAQDGGTAGVLSEVVVNVRSGNVRYAVLAPARGAMMALPLIALELAPPDGGEAQLVMRPQPPIRPRGNPIAEALFDALLAPERD